eukprot:4880205-Karenia_brevis.AAC.1
MMHVQGHGPWSKKSKQYLDLEQQSNPKKLPKDRRHFEAEMACQPKHNQLWPLQVTDLLCAQHQDCQERHANNNKNTK